MWCYWQLIPPYFLCFQHQGQHWKCHQHLKKRVPDIQGQCPKSTSSLHHTPCRYFKELLFITLFKSSKFSVFQACKSTSVSTAGPVHPKDTKTRKAHPSKPARCFSAYCRLSGFLSSNQPLSRSSCSAPHSCASASLAEGTDTTSPLRSQECFWVETVWINQMLQHPELCCRGAILFLNCTW